MSGLRQRKPAAGAAHGRATTPTEKLAVAVTVAGDALDKAWPYVEMGVDLCQQGWKKIEPYHPQDMLQAIFGLLLCFFGGHYMITFAAIEAAMACGFHKSLKHVRVLYVDYLAVHEASKKDDLKDENNDGVADVKQISKKELATRKLALVLTTADPHRVSMAVTGLWTGFMGVVATLRVQFAQTITLGSVIGNVFAEGATKFVEPSLRKVVDDKYHKWIPLFIAYTCRFVGVSIAWMVERTIAAFYSATRGAQVFARGVLAYCARHGYAPPFDEGSQLFVAVTTGVAVIGFGSQLYSRMSLPFPFNLLLLPVTIVEWILMYFVGVSGMP